MRNPKRIAIIVLVMALLLLAGTTYSLLAQFQPPATEATATPIVTSTATSGQPKVGSGAQLIPLYIYTFDGSDTTAAGIAPWIAFPTNKAVRLEYTDQCHPLKDQNHAAQLFPQLSDDPNAYGAAYITFDVDSALQAGGIVMITADLKPIDIPGDYTTLHAVINADLSDGTKSLTVRGLATKLVAGDWTRVTLTLAYRMTLPDGTIFESDGKIRAVVIGVQSNQQYSGAVCIDNVTYLGLQR